MLHSWKVSLPEVIATASRLVTSAAQAINNANPDCTVTQEVVEANIFDQIKRVAEKWSADLVVVGSHGRRGFNHFVMGSVSFELVRQTSLPLVLVKPDRRTLKIWENFDYPSLTRNSFDEALAKAQSNSKPERIMLALDGTALSEQLVEFLPRTRVDS